MNQFDIVLCFPTLKGTKSKPDHRMTGFGNNTITAVTARAFEHFSATGCLPFRIRVTESNKQKNVVAQVELEKA